MSINEDTAITRIEKTIENTPIKDLKILSVKTLAEIIGIGKNLISKNYKGTRDFNVGKLIFFVDDFMCFKWQTNEIRNIYGEVVENL